MSKAEKLILVLCGIGGLLFAFALKSFGDDIIVLTNETYRTVTFPAGDGANEITQIIDGKGNVLSESSTAVHVPSGVVPAILDEESRRFYYGDVEYIIVTPSMWCDLTNEVARLRDMSSQRWRKEHETVQGRAMWHGAATNRIVTAQGITWLYRDGYTYFEGETNSVKRVRPPDAKKRPSGASARQPAPTLPPRLAEKRKAMKTRAGEVRVVNAVFGPGGKVIKAEEAK